MHQKLPRADVVSDGDQPTRRGDKVEHVEYGNVGESGVAEFGSAVIIGHGKFARENPSAFLNVPARADEDSRGAG